MEIEGALRYTRGRVIDNRKCAPIKKDCEGRSFLIWGRNEALLEKQLKGNDWHTEE